MDLPWSEDYMLRQSYPAYNAWCEDDEEESSEKEFLGEDPAYTAEVERANNE